MHQECSRPPGLPWEDMDLQGHSCAAVKYCGLPQKNGVMAFLHHGQNKNACMVPSPCHFLLMAKVYIHWTNMSILMLSELWLNTLKGKRGGYEVY